MGSLAAQNNGVGLPSARHLIAGLVLVTTLISLNGTSATALGQAAQSAECFAQTGFCIDDAAIREYFHLRAGVATFGYPVSRVFVLRGFRVQIFQGHVLQILPNGHVTSLNLLGPDLMPA